MADAIAGDEASSEIAQIGCDKRQPGKHGDALQVESPGIT